jgi:hypothetical protein
MDVYRFSSASRQRASWIIGLARRVHDVVSEMNYASARATELRLSYDLAESDQAPDTYAEFLLRTPGTSLREPPARCRQVR